MAIYNYTDTGAININLNLTTTQAKALSRFITTHGGGETSYSTVRSLNEELRNMLTAAYTAIQQDAEFCLKYGKFDEPVEYDVDFISQEDAKANRDELAERDNAMVNWDPIVADLEDELEDEIPF